MKITFDPAKRTQTLEDRGLDFARCDEVFLRHHVTTTDDRINYGEPRFITVGHLDGRMVLVAGTPRDGSRRIISMRNTNARERKKFAPQVGGP